MSKRNVNQLHKQCDPFFWQYLLLWCCKPHTQAVCLQSRYPSSLESNRTRVILKSSSANALPRRPRRSGSKRKRSRVAPTYQLAWHRGFLSHSTAHVEPAGARVGASADCWGPEEPAGEDAGQRGRDISSRPSGPEARRQSSDQCGQQLHPHGEVEALGKWKGWGVAAIWSGRLGCEAKLLLPLLARRSGCPPVSPYASASRLTLLCEAWWSTSVGVTLPCLLSPSSRASPGDALGRQSLPAPCSLWASHLTQLCVFRPLHQRPLKMCSVPQSQQQQKQQHLLQPPHICPSQKRLLYWIWLRPLRCPTSCGKKQWTMQGSLEPATQCLARPTSGVSMRDLCHKGVIMIRVRLDH